MATGEAALAAQALQPDLILWTSICPGSTVRRQPGGSSPVRQARDLRWWCCCPPMTRARGVCGGRQRRGRLCRQTGVRATTAVRSGPRHGQLTWRGPLPGSIASTHGPASCSPRTTTVGGHCGAARRGRRLEVVAVVADLPQLLDAVADGPDAVLTDIRMPPAHTTEGIQAARRIRADHPEVGVVVLSQSCRGGVPSSCWPTARPGWAICSRSVSAGWRSWSGRSRRWPGAVRCWTPRWLRACSPTGQVASSPLARLTERERAVLEQMAEGRNNAAIAAPCS